MRGRDEPTAIQRTATHYATGVQLRTQPSETTSDNHGRPAPPDATLELVAEKRQRTSPWNRP